MSKGSFQGLYTFSEVGEIYGFDSSILRKQAACEKLAVGKDIKKFGKTWVMTEQSMIERFGSLKFENYLNKKAREEAVNNKGKVRKRACRNKSVDSINQGEERVKDSWLAGDIKGVELKSFGFSANDGI